MQKREKRREEKKKSDRKKNCDLVGIDPCKKKEKKKKLSIESNLGPLTLRGNGHYDYNS